MQAARDHWWDTQWAEVTYGQAALSTKTVFDFYKPTIAADQVNASLYRWLGFSEPKILSIFPNLTNLKSPYIEFI